MSRSRGSPAATVLAIARVHRSFLREQFRCARSEGSRTPKSHGPGADLRYIGGPHLAKESEQLAEDLADVAHTKRYGLFGDKVTSLLGGSTHFLSQQVACQLGWIHLHFA